MIDGRCGRCEEPFFVLPEGSLSGRGVGRAESLANTMKRDSCIGLSFGNPMTSFSEGPPPGPAGIFMDQTRALASIGQTPFEVGGGAK